MKEEFLKSEEKCGFWGTHPSFDPSILELLLAIESDATLIIPPYNWDKPSNNSMPSCLNELNIDFMQTTPTKLMLMSNERIEWIFKKNSPVKNLFVGGENFPTSFFNEVYTPETTVKIYNIYGVTEISCWVTFSHSPIKFPRKNFETSIGSNMSDTVLEIENDGKMFIKSKIRECVINFH